jgi:hypothetical protein
VNFDSPLRDYLILSCSDVLKDDLDTMNPVENNDSTKIDADDNSKASLEEMAEIVGIKVDNQLVFFKPVEQVFS